MNLDTANGNVFADFRSPVVIPAYNAASTIGETIDSLLRQTPRGNSRISRIIVADDASTDGTKEVVEKFKRHDQRIEWWPSNINCGERATINRTFARLSESGADWCFVIHADDVTKPLWIETLSDVMDACHQDVVSICCSWDDWFAEKIIPGDERPEAEVVTVEGGLSTAIGTLQRGCWWHFSGCAMQLRNFFKVGLFCEDMPQLGDLEWLVRSSLANFELRYVPRTLIKYRQTLGNVSSVSFRTNRDLKEALLICRRHGENRSMATALSQFAGRYTRTASRRIVSSILRGDWNRTCSAVKYQFALIRINRFPYTPTQV